MEQPPLSKRDSGDGMYANFMSSENLVRRQGHVSKGVDFSHMDTSWNLCFHELSIHHVLKRNFKYQKCT